MSADDIPPNDENGDPRKVPGTPRKPYKVGYKNPPQHTQFKPGHSGNPTGRRRRPRTLAEAIEAELNKKMRIIVASVERNLTKREILAMQIVNEAVNKKHPSQKLILQISGRREESSSNPADEQVVQADDLRLIAKYAPHLLSDAERAALDPESSESDESDQNDSAPPGDLPEDLE